MKDPTYHAVLVRNDCGADAVYVRPGSRSTSRPG